VIVPNGVLFASTNAARHVRQTLLDHCDLQAVITMPAGVFKPYAGVATAILIFEKDAPTKSVWFYEMTADGFSLSDTRAPVLDNDIPDILQKWPKREEGIHSFRVNREALSEHGDVLIPGRYRERETEVVDHDTPVKILSDVLKVEQKNNEKLSGLQKQLARK
jgi:type I restriction enzyme M protein